MRYKLIDGHTNLLHSIAVAHGNGIVLKRIEVNRYAHGRADLVMAAVTLAYGAGIIVINHELLGKHAVNLARLVAQLVLLQRQNCGFIRSDGGMQMQNVPHVAIFKRFFIVSVAQEHQQHSFYANGRLYDIRHILFVGERIGIGKILTGLLGMCAQVEIGAARNAPKLAPVVPLE